MNQDKMFILCLGWTIKETLDINKREDAFVIIASAPGVEVECSLDLDEISANSMGKLYKFLKTRCVEIDKSYVPEEIGSIS